ncbi:hypothetical protein ACYUJ6_08960 [Clostridium sp. JNZ X4-2]
MRNEKNFRLEERIYEDVIDEKEIFATETDDLVLNCDGEPCNFSYNK